MIEIPKKRLWGRWMMLGLLFAASMVSSPRGISAESCKRISLDGEASAGQEWKSAIGQGWIFRVLPIDAGPQGYSGWDLVVDRAQPAGYPDALLLATLPYNSINQREIGTTFGLRAQDAIGWNPRSFLFLTDTAAFRDAQGRLRSLGPQGGIQAAASHASEGKSPDAQALSGLLELQKRASSGEFHIIDARITPGVADPAPYARNWALASSATPHQVEPAASGKSSPLGSLHWMRFSVTLWLPKSWLVPEGLHSAVVPCPK